MTEKEYSQFLGYNGPQFDLDGLDEYLDDSNITSDGDYFDWSDEGAVTGVKNQGSCGSCWAFSTIGGIEGLYAIKKGSKQTFSEQQIVDCDKTDAGCNGGWPYRAYEYVVSAGGIATESAYPYKGVDGTCKSVDPTFEIKGHTEVTKKSGSALKTALKVNPISVCLNAAGFTFQTYSSGVLAEKGCPTSMDHCITLVGYGTADDGTPYWRLKNSWGTGWGEEGFIRLEMTDSGKGTCGMYQENSYPHV